MKVTPLDFVLSGTVLTLLMLATLVFVALGLHPVSKRLLAEYYVVADCLAFLLVYGVISGLFIRMLLKVWPLKSGEFDMDSPNFTYWKVVIMVSDFGQGALKPFTLIFLRPVVAVLYGARIGRNVGLGGIMADPFMISIGDDVATGVGSQIWGNVIAKGKMFLGPVKIGNGVTIGMNVVVFPDVEIGDNAVVALNSVVTQGSRIPAGETWKGNPARKWC